MRDYWKNVCLIFCVIYTTLTLIYFFGNGPIPAETMPLFILMAAFSSLLTIILIPKDSYSNRRLVFNQVSYFFCIMAAIVFIGYVAKWEQSLFSISLNGGIVLGLFLLIKYLLFSRDQKEAIKINAQLQKRQAEKEGNS